ncbi:hypothetical protein KHV-MN_00019 [Cyprinid herpesvirus 3]|nr:hypothetical protein KHV-MN_00019 [Cyprinid herpesvirus 3]
MDSTLDRHHTVNTQLAILDLSLATPATHHKATRSSLRLLLQQNPRSRQST